MTYEEIKEQRKWLNDNVDGLEYIKNLIHLKKIGNIYTALCPFHKEKTESLRVYPEGHKGDDGTPQDHTSWYCFGCKRGGDIIKFEELYYDLDSVEQAIESLKSKYSLEYSGESHMLEVRKNLLEMQNSTPSARFSLQEVNLICSEMCRNHLHEVYHKHSELFDDEFSKIQTIYKKLDGELLKRNAIEAEILITFTQNSLKNMKKALTNR